MWYAFRTTPQKELAAHEALTKAGFTSLFAHEIREQKTRRHVKAAAKVIPRTIPLLPGYALACHETDDPLDYWLYRLMRLTIYGGPMRGTIPIARSVVGCNGRPTPIPQWAIDNLAARSGVVFQLPKSKPITAGSSARIKLGPLAGHTVKVEAIRGQQARVLLGILGSTREITVRVDAMEQAA